MVQNKEKKKAIRILILCVSLLVIFFHAAYFGSQKEGYYLDETLSFYLANNNTINLSKVVTTLQNHSAQETEAIFRKEVIDAYSWRTNDEIISKYTVLNNERFSYFSTYLMQATDVHPPLYYFVIKTICSIFPHMDLMIVGFIVNVFFLLLTCIFIYKLSLIVFDNSICAISTVLLYGLSFSFINNVTYYRMYALLTFWLSFSVYINVKWFVTGFQTDRKTLLKLCITEYLAMLTQYFALFFCIPIFALNIYIMGSENRKVSQYIKYNVFTGIIYLVTWPFSISHILFSNRGNDVTGNFRSFNYIHKLFDYNPVMSKSIFAYSDKLYLLTALVMITVIVIKIIKRVRSHASISFEQNNHAGILLYVFVVAFFYYCLAAIASPWTSDRYIAAAIPLFSIIVIYVLSELMGVVIKNKSIIGVMLLLFGIALCLRWHHKLTPDFLYNLPERVDYKNNCNKYEGIIIDKKDAELFSEIELNFMHPRVFRTDDANMNLLEDSLNINSSYFVYVSKTADVDGVINQINNLGFDTEKLDCETDYYEIFKLN